jgi:hypothetical protein
MHWRPRGKVGGGGMGNDRRREGSFFISALFYFGKFLYYARKNVFDVFIPKFFFKALVFFQILFQFSEFLRAGFQ